MGIVTRAMAAAAALSAAGLFSCSPRRPRRSQCPISSADAPPRDLVRRTSSYRLPTSRAAPSCWSRAMNPPIRRSPAKPAAPPSTAAAPALARSLPSPAAQIGSVGVSLAGSAFGVNESNNSGIGTINLSNVSAGFIDTLEFSTDELPPGFLVLVKATLKLSQTDLFAIVTGGPVGGFRGGQRRPSWPSNPPASSSRRPRAATGSPTPSTTSAARRTTSCIRSLNIPSPSRSSTSSLSSAASSSPSSGEAFASSQLTNAGSVTAKFANDSSKTLNWGGITEVLNPATGAPITNWTLTSESGFDYTKPFPVPEPAGRRCSLGPRSSSRDSGPKDSPADLVAIEAAIKRPLRHAFLGACEWPQSGVV